MIKPPDHATRVAILRKRAALDRIASTDPTVLELIADRVTDNIRALEGALIRIVAFHSLTRQPIDLELAADGPRRCIHPRPTSRSADRRSPTIQRRASPSYYGARARSSCPPRAAPPSVTWPRQLAIHLARDLTDARCTRSVDAFGGRNHATVLHACKRVSERMDTDQQAVDELDGAHGAVIDRSRADRNY